jgi:hypothetical protein
MWLLCGCHRGGMVAAAVLCVAVVLPAIIGTSAKAGGGGGRNGVTAFASSPWSCSNPSSPSGLVRTLSPLALLPHQQQHRCNTNDRRRRALNLPPLLYRKNETTTTTTTGNVDLLNDARLRFERTASQEKQTDAPCILTIDNVRYNVTAWGTKNNGSVCAHDNLSLFLSCITPLVEFLAG